MILKNIYLFPFRILLFFMRELLDILVITFEKSVKLGVKKKLLIVRLDAIGDFVIFLDSFKEYRKFYPQDEWEITLLGNNAWRDLAINLFYADHYSFIDRNLFYRNPFYRYKILRNIRRVGFDVVVQPTYSREYFFGDTVVRVSGAGERIGSVGDTQNVTLWQKKRSDRWYTKLVEASTESLSELERNAEFIRGLGVNEFQATVPFYPVDIITSQFQCTSDLDKPYFIVFPGAGWEGRMWGEDRFAEVAKYLYSKTGWIPVLCGGLGEEHIAERVISFENDLPWENLAGKVGLPQLVKIIKDSKMIVVNETSAVHIASAVSCPAVCIIGGGHFGRFYPYGDPNKNRIAFKKMDCYGCNWQCKYPTVRCIEEVTVDAVLKEVDQILDKFYKKEIVPPS